MSKRKNFQVDRRRLRRAEKQFDEDSAPKTDKTLGKVSRRCWGGGKVSK